MHDATVSYDKSTKVSPGSETVEHNGFAAHGLEVVIYGWYQGQLHLQHREAAGGDSRDWSRPHLLQGRARFSCRTTGGWVAASHLPRWQAAGVHGEPTFRQREHEYKRRLAYDLERILVLPERLRQIGAQ